MAKNTSQLTLEPVAKNGKEHVTADEGTVAKNGKEHVTADDITGGKLTKCSVWERRLWELSDETRSYMHYVMTEGHVVRPGTSQQQLEQTLPSVA